VLICKTRVIGESLRRSRPMFQALLSISSHLPTFPMEHHEIQDHITPTLEYSFIFIGSCFMLVIVDGAGSDLPPSFNNRAAPYIAIFCILHQPHCHNTQLFIVQQLPQRSKWHGPDPPTATSVPPLLAGTWSINTPGWGLHAV
jgi:hypothetical protein